MNWSRFALILGLIALVSLTRFLPLPVNFSPIGAIALFGGAMLHRKSLGLAIPLLALFVSDLFLGFYSGIFFVYLGFALSVAIGWALKKRLHFLSIAAGSFGAAVLFFIMSNLGVWLTGSMYPLTLEGLVHCYAAAIPFFGNTLSSTVLFSGILFGAYHFLSHRTSRCQTDVQFR